MAENILDTLMTTLKDVEITDSGQALDLFNENREKEIISYVGSLLKENIPLPEIEFNSAFISKYSGGEAAALYDSESKKIILDEYSSIEDSRFKNFIAHEVLHYVDDFAAPDTIPGETAWRTGQPNELIDPEIRGDIIRYGAGWDYESESQVSIPDWAFQYAQNVSNPQEHLSYYTEQERGIVSEYISEDAAFKAVDQWKPLVEHETISPGRWPWSEPDTMRSWTGGIDPQYNILDISKFTQDRGAILDVFDELADEYFTDEGRKAFYQRKKY